MVMAVMMRRALFMAQFEQWFIPMSCDRVFLCPATTHCQPDSVISQDIGNFRTLRGWGVFLILAFHVRCGVNGCRQAARAKLAKELWVHMWVRSPA
jgi:hypothetical protein